MRVGVRILAILLFLVLLPRTVPAPLYRKGLGPHRLLSATHSDTVPASPVIGNTIAANGGNNWAAVAPNITTTRKFFRATGDGVNGGFPAWDTLTAGDVAAHNLLSATHGDTNSAAAVVQRGDLVVGTSPTVAGVGTFTSTNNCVGGTNAGAVCTVPGDCNSAVCSFNGVTISGGTTSQLVVGYLVVGPGTDNTRTVATIQTATVFTTDQPFSPALSGSSVTIIQATTKRWDRFPPQTASANTQASSILMGDPQAASGTTWKAAPSCDPNFQGLGFAPPIEPSLSSAFTCKDIPGDLNYWHVTSAAGSPRVSIAGVLTTYQTATTFTPAANQLLCVPFQVTRGASLAVPAVPHIQDLAVTVIGTCSGGTAPPGTICTTNTPCVGGGTCVGTGGAGAKCRLALYSTQSVNDFAPNVKEYNDTVDIDATVLGLKNSGTIDIVTSAFKLYWNCVECNSASPMPTLQAYPQVNGWGVQVIDTTGAAPTFSTAGATPKNVLRLSTTFPTFPATLSSATYFAQGVVPILYYYMGF